MLSFSSLQIILSLARLRRRASVSCCCSLVPEECTSFVWVDRCACKEGAQGEYYVFARCRWRFVGLVHIARDWNIVTIVLAQRFWQPRSLAASSKSCVPVLSTFKVPGHWRIVGLLAQGGWPQGLGLASR